MIKLEELLVNDGWEGIEFCYQQGWTDGLPVVPPTRKLLDLFLDQAGWDPDEILLTEPVRGRKVTAEKIAINIIMAGCLPSYAPVIEAVLSAMSDPKYSLHAPVTSTGGAASLIFINGPIRKELEINCGVNLFGPGWRANSTIGRAIRLIYLNCLNAKPGVLDKSTQGWPGKYSICFGELEEKSPWNPYHVDLGYDPNESTITIFASEAPHNILNHHSNDAKGILLTAADAMSAAGSFSKGQSLVVLAPEHVQYVKNDGWSKWQVKEFLYENAKRTIADLKRTGKIAGQMKVGDENKWAHRGLSPDDIVVLVGGGDAGGHSSFFPSWSRGRGNVMVTKPIRKRGGLR
ncbi:hypothetical protein [Neobacillus bataviensis]|uniref:hypothetical protein n=1 Tax=Neobacillus bataviensis TaxID=220685 RepID=UPI001CBADE12|nr:hypothetical protein [Neobacillus bataviensis]